MAAVTTYELLSLCPAEPGWTAVLGEERVPVIAWGVFRKKVGSSDKGTEMHGVLADSSPGGPVRYFDNAAGAPNFEGYLPPVS